MTSVLIRKAGDCPGGPAVKNLPVNEGDNGFDIWSGKIYMPHIATETMSHNYPSPCTQGLSSSRSTATRKLES